MSRARPRLSAKTAFFREEALNRLYREQVDRRAELPLVPWPPLFAPVLIVTPIPRPVAVGQLRTVRRNRGLATVGQLRTVRRNRGLAAGRAAVSIIQVKYILAISSNTF